MDVYVFQSASTGRASCVCCRWLNLMSSEEGNVVEDVTVEEEPSEDEFEVEQILDVREKRGRAGKPSFEYLVAWKGYSAESNTWESQENLSHCHELLDEFWKRRNTPSAPESSDPMEVDEKRPLEKERLVSKEGLRQKRFPVSYEDAWKDDEETQSEDDGQRSTSTEGTAVVAVNLPPRIHSDGSVHMPEAHEFLVENIIAHRGPEDGQEYLVKFRSRGYVHCTWYAKSRVLKEAGDGFIKRYFKKTTRLFPSVEEPENDTLTDWMAYLGHIIPIDFMEPERIIDVVRSEQDDSDLACLVKWKGLPYDSCTWESANYLGLRDTKPFLDFERRHSVERLPGSISQCQIDRSYVPMVGARKPEKRQDRGEFDQDADIPLTFPEHLSLKDYQVTGLKWLVYNWHQNRNSMLADEVILLFIRV